MTLFSAVVVCGAAGCPRLRALVVDGTFFFKCVFAGKKIGLIKKGHREF